MSSSVLEVLKRVQVAAEADAQANGKDFAAHESLLEEIHNLKLAAETPAERTRNVNYQIMQNICIRIANELGIFFIISEKNGEPVTAVELAKMTGAEKGVIVRIMRLVCYIGYCTLSAPATYLANETTHLLTQKAAVGGLKHFNSFGFATGARIIDLIRTTGLHEAPNPTKNEQIPFEYAHGKSMFAFMQSDAEEKAAFDDYMTLRKNPNMPQWFETFFSANEAEDGKPRIEGLKTGSEDVLVVDIGGGSGHDMALLHQRRPDLPGRLIVQDLPETLAKLESPPEGVQMMPHDFFTPQPIHNAKVYFFRAIMHDWPDTQCINILKLVVDAMEGGYSRIVIEDMIVAEEGVSLRAAGMDVLMMMLLGGVERTERQWRDLLEGVGLEVVSVRVLRAGGESLIEARKVVG